MVGFDNGGWIVRVIIWVAVGIDVVEDYDFVDAEDGEGAGQGACEEGFLVDGMCATGGY